MFFKGDLQKFKVFKKRAKGFTLIEALVVIAIFAVMIAGGFVILSSGESAWFTTDARIEIQENLRQMVDKMTLELNQTGLDKNGVAQYTVTDAGGINGSDIIRFSIPIICHGGDNFLDSTSNIAHWGAPLSWGCTSSPCMDADNNCATVDYKFIEYSIDASNKLIRKVLGPAGGLLRQDTLGQNVVDLQMLVSADKNVLTLTLTGRRNSALNRILTLSTSFKVYLRNRG